MNLTLSWDASANATSYEYCYDTSNDNACSAWTSAGSGLSATISGLSPGSTYYWQARASNGAGTTFADGGSAAFWSFVTQQGARVGKDLLGNFGTSSGIWALHQTDWTQVHRWSPKTIVTGDFDGNGLDDVAIDFSPNAGVWLWMNHATWVRVHDLDTTTMAVGDIDQNGKSDLVLSFPRFGVWAWMNNSTWRSLHAFEAVHLAVGDLDGGGVDDIVADFPGHGLWALRNNTTWEFVHPAGVTTMATVDLDNNGKAELVASFKDFGLWVFRNNTSWTFLQPYAASVIAVGQLDGGLQPDLVVDFGPSVGIWTYRNSALWSQVHFLSSTALVVADFDGDGRDEVAIGFGTAGVWRYTVGAANPWTFVHPAAASALAAIRALPAARPGVTLSVTPNSGTQGTTAFSIVGQNYSPGGTVRRLARAAGEFKELAPTTADSSGGINGPVNLGCDFAPGTIEFVAIDTRTWVLGDLNGDGIVNSVDFSILNTKWFTTDALADLNGDGLVNSLDSSILNLHWNETGDEHRLISGVHVELQPDSQCSK